MSASIVHPMDETLPAGRLAALGLQHVLVMYAGAIAVPLIVGRALKLGPGQVAMLISADLFVCGIVTLIQSLGVTRYFGIKLPVMMGVTFAAVGPMEAFANAMPGVDGARASASDREYSTPTDLVHWPSDRALALAPSAARDLP